MIGDRFWTYLVKVLSVAAFVVTMAMAMTVTVGVFVMVTSTLTLGDILVSFGIREMLVFGLCLRAVGMQSWYDYDDKEWQLKLYRQRSRDGGITTSQMVWAWVLAGMMLVVDLVVTWHVAGWSLPVISLVSVVVCVAVFVYGKQLARQDQERG